MSAPADRTKWARSCYDGTPASVMDLIEHLRIMSAYPGITGEVNAKACELAADFISECVPGDLRETIEL